MAQPSPLAFPDLQIYSRLLHALPEFFIRYMVWPENSHYFPEAFINKAIAVININGYLFVDFITRNPK